MTEAMSTLETVRQAWKAELQPVTCDRCGWVFLVPRDRARAQCPHCHQGGLVESPSMPEEMLYPHPPELVIPFRITRAQMEAAIASFASGIPYPPEGLNYAFLKSHLQPVYLPVWLVDAQVEATWSAETGFDYQVISHQETFDQDGAGWKTQEVKETRVRWENRVGRIHRPYANIPAPAMDDGAKILGRLGDFDQDSALPYDPGCLGTSLVRVPDHTPEEAWNEAVQAFTNAASEECRQACAADHLRQFRWKARFDELNWTLMLLPVYTSFYYADSGTPQPVLIHGQTGQLSGTRRASTRRAWATSLVLLLVGIILFLLGLILDSFVEQAAVLAGISTILVLLGIAGGVGSFIPVITALEFNRKQTPQ